MLLNWCCKLNNFNAKKSVGGHVKKSMTSSFFNRITFYLAVSHRTFQETNLQNFRIKCQAVAEKTAKNFKKLLYLPHPVCECNLTLCKLMQMVQLSQLQAIFSLR